MRAFLRWAALGLALFSLVFWFFGGPNPGWTKTSVDRIEKDAVTGLEGHFPEKRFVPGVDFLGASLLAAGLLAGCSFCCRKNKVSEKQGGQAPINR